MTPLDTIKKGEEEFDRNQRLFLSRKFHSTRFNNWHKSQTRALLQSLIDEAEGEKTKCSDLDDDSCIGANKAIQSYQNRLQALIDKV